VLALNSANNSSVSRLDPFTNLASFRAKVLHKMGFERVYFKQLAIYTDFCWVV